MCKSIAVGLLIVGGLMFAGCSQETKTSVEKAKQKGSGAAESTKEAAGEISGKAGEAAKDAHESLTSSAAMAADALKGVPGGPELLKKVTEFFNSSSNTLQGITDVESAKAALPKLEELTGSIDELSKAMANLPEPARSAVFGVWDKGIAKLKALAEKVLALPGVGSVLKPTVDAMLSKLEAVAERKG